MIKSAVQEALMDDDMTEVMAMCCNSLKIHCQVVHGPTIADPTSGRFTREFSPKHDEFFEAWDDPTVKKICVIAHRNFGKSSLVQLGAPSQSIAFSKYKYIVPVSSTATGALEHSENLKFELETNIRLQAMLGNLKSDSWAKDGWVTTNGVKVLPRGRGQQIRGILFRDQRPDLLIGDDLEDDESVMSKEQRTKTKEFVYAQMLNTVDKSKPYRIVFIGTILHEDALLQGFRESKDWVVIDAPLCDDKRKSYWPQYMKDDEVETMYQEFLREGLLAVFSREFRNIANPKEDAAFREEYFRYYSDTKEEVDKHGKTCHHIEFSKEKDSVESFVILDPAKTAKVHSAETAVVGVSIQYTGNSNRIFIRDVVSKKLYPDQIYAETFDMADRIGASTIGYEVTGLSEFIIQPMHDMMFKRGKIYELIELKAKKGEGEYSARGRGKEGRVAALAAYYRAGVIYHPSNGVADGLEEQLLAFPLARLWDIMDATAYLIQMLNRGERFFIEELDKSVYEELEEAENEAKNESRILKKMEEEDAYMLDMVT